MSYSEREMHADLMCALTNLTDEVAALRKTIESSPILFQHIVKTEAELEPEEIPEAVTARWSVWYNAMFHSSTLTCSNCGYKHDVAIRTSNGKSPMPATCPQCKAVMIGVE